MGEKIVMRLGKTLFLPNLDDSKMYPLTTSSESELDDDMILTNNCFIGWPQGGAGFLCLKTAVVSIYLKYIFTNIYFVYLNKSF